METGLEGKGVLVTGASGGIGAACARAFAAEGARVAVHYHRGEERARSVASEVDGPARARARTGGSARRGGGAARRAGVGLAELYRGERAVDDAVAERHEAVARRGVAG